MVPFNYAINSCTINPARCLGIDDRKGSIMVGKDATTDGSVITSHTCDGMYRTWLRWEKAQEHEKGATEKIYRGRN